MSSLRSISITSVYLLIIFTKLLHGAPTSNEKSPADDADDRSEEYYGKEYKADSDYVLAEYYDYGESTTESPPDVTSTPVTNPVELTSPAAGTSVANSSEPHPRPERKPTDSLADLTEDVGFYDSFNINDDKTYDSLNINAETEEPAADSGLPSDIKVATQLVPAPTEASVAAENKIEVTSIENQQLHTAADDQHLASGAEETAEGKPEVPELATEENDKAAASELDQEVPVLTVEKVEELGSTISQPQQATDLDDEYNVGGYDDEYVQKSEEEDSYDDEEPEYYEDEEPTKEPNGDQVQTEKPTDAASHQEDDEDQDGEPSNEETVDEEQTDKPIDAAIKEEEHDVEEEEDQEESFEDAAITEKVEIDAGPATDDGLQDEENTTEDHHHIEQSTPTESTNDPADENEGEVAGEEGEDGNVIEVITDAPTKSPDDDVTHAQPSATETTETTDFVVGAESETEEGIHTETEGSQQAETSTDYFQEMAHTDAEKATEAVDELTSEEDTENASPVTVEEGLGVTDDYLSPRTEMITESIDLPSSAEEETESQPVTTTHKSLGMTEISAASEISTSETTTQHEKESGEEYETTVSPSLEDPDEGPIDEAHTEAETSTVSGEEPDKEYEESYETSDEGHVTSEPTTAHPEESEEEYAEEDESADGSIYSVEGSYDDEAHTEAETSTVSSEEPEEEYEESYETSDEEHVTSEPTTEHPEESEEEYAEENESADGSIYSAEGSYDNDEAHTEAEISTVSSEEPEEEYEESDEEDYVESDQEYYEESEEDYEESEEDYYEESFETSGEGHVTSEPTTEYPEETEESYAEEDESADGSIYSAEGSYDDDEAHTGAETITVSSEEPEEEYVESYETGGEEHVTASTEDHNEVEAETPITDESGNEGKPEDFHSTIGDDEKVIIELTRGSGAEKEAIQYVCYPMKGTNQGEQQETLNKEDLVTEEPSSLTTHHATLSESESEPYETTPVAYPTVDGTSEVIETSSNYEDTVIPTQFKVSGTWTIPPAYIEEDIEGITTQEDFEEATPATTYPDSLVLNSESPTIATNADELGHDPRIEDVTHVDEAVTSVTEPPIQTPKDEQHDEKQVYIEISISEHEPRIKPRLPPAAQSTSGTPPVSLDEIITPSAETSQKSVTQETTGEPTSPQEIDLTTEAEHASTQEEDEVFTEVTTESQSEPDSSTISAENEENAEEDHETFPSTINLIDLLTPSKGIMDIVTSSADDILTTLPWSPLEETPSIETTTAVAADGETEADTEPSQDEASHPPSTEYATDVPTPAHSSNDYEEHSVEFTTNGLAEELTSYEQVESTVEPSQGTSDDGETSETTEDTSEGDEFTTVADENENLSEEDEPSTSEYPTDVTINIKDAVQTEEPLTETVTGLITTLPSTPLPQTGAPTDEVTAHSDEQPTKEPSVDPVPSELPTPASDSTDSAISETPSQSDNQEEDVNTESGHQEAETPQPLLTTLPWIPLHTTSYLGSEVSTEDITTIEVLPQDESTISGLSDELTSDDQLESTVGPSQGTSDDRESSETTESTPEGDEVTTVADDVEQLSEENEAGTPDYPTEVTTDVANAAQTEEPLTETATGLSTTLPSIPLPQTGAPTDEVTAHSEAQPTEEPSVDHVPSELPTPASDSTDSASETPSQADNQEEEVNTEGDEHQEAETPQSLLTTLPWIPLQTTVHLAGSEAATEDTTATEVLPKVNESIEDIVGTTGRPRLFSDEEEPPADELENVTGITDGPEGQTGPSSSAHEETATDSSFDPSTPSSGEDGPLDDIEDEGLSETDTSPETTTSGYSSGETTPNENYDEDEEDDDEDDGYDEDEDDGYDGDEEDEYGEEDEQEATEAQPGTSEAPNQPAEEDQAEPEATGNPPAADTGTEAPQNLTQTKPPRRRRPPKKQGRVCEIVLERGPKGGIRRRTVCKEIIRGPRRPIQKTTKPVLTTEPLVPNGATSAIIAVNPTEPAQAILTSQPPLLLDLTVPSASVTSSAANEEPPTNDQVHSTESQPQVSTENDGAGLATESFQEVTAEASTYKHGGPAILETIADAVIENLETIADAVIEHLPHISEAAEIPELGADSIGTEKPFDAASDLSLTGHVHADAAFETTGAGGNTIDLTFKPDPNHLSEDQLSGLPTASFQTEGTLEGIQSATQENPDAAHIINMIAEKVEERLANALEAAFGTLGQPNGLLPDIGGTPGLSLPGILSGQSNGGIHLSGDLNKEGSLGVGIQGPQGTHGANVNLGLSGGISGGIQQGDQNNEGSLGFGIEGPQDTQHGSNLDVGLSGDLNKEGSLGFGIQGPQGTHGANLDVGLSGDISGGIQLGTPDKETTISPGAPNIASDRAVDAPNIGSELAVDAPNILGGVAVTGKEQLSGGISGSIRSPLDNGRTRNQHGRTSGGITSGISRIIESFGNLFGLG